MARTRSGWRSATQPRTKKVARVPVSARSVEQPLRRPRDTALQVGHCSRAYHAREDLRVEVLLDVERQGVVHRGHQSSSPTGASAGCSGWSASVSTRTSRASPATRETRGAKSSSSAAHEVSAVICRALPSELRRDARHHGGPEQIRQDVHHVADGGHLAGADIDHPTGRAGRPGGGQRRGHRILHVDEVVGTRLGLVHEGPPLPHRLDQVRQRPGRRRSPSGAARTR